MEFSDGKLKQKGFFSQCALESLYQVSENGPKVFQVAVGGTEEAGSVDCLKPHLGTAGVSAADPPPPPPPPPD